MKGNKHLRHIKLGIQSLFIALTVFIFLMVLISLNTNKVGDQSFFGNRFFIVLSNSMKPKFQAGDLIITKEVSPETLKEHDVITFYFRDGVVVTHQIVEKVTIDGKDAFITKGTNVDQVDDEPVFYDQLIGKYSFKIPKLGVVLNFFQSTWGYLLLIALPLSSIIVYNLYKIFKISVTLKKEKAFNIAEKERALEEERLKNQQMEEELRKLKQQLITDDNG